MRVLVGLVILASSARSAFAIDDLGSAAVPLALGIGLFLALGRLQVWRVPYLGFGFLPICFAVQTVFAGSFAANLLLPSCAFVGLSFLIAGLKGYAGCEVTAIPNLFRNEPVEHGCPALWDAVDRWEAGRGRPA